MAEKNDNIYDWLGIEMRPNNLAALAFLFAFGAFTPNVMASIVAVSGDFFALEYDDNQAALLTVIDELTIAGNSVKIQPSDYSAVATGPFADQQTIDASVSFRLRAINGYRFTGFDWLAQGDYTRVSGLSSATVDVDGSLAIEDQDSQVSRSSDFSVGPLTQEGAGINWGASALVDAQDLVASGLLSDVLVTIDSTLEAGVENGGIQAKSQMKFARLLVGLDPQPGTVPQTLLSMPSTFTLLLGGVAGLLGLSRRWRFPAA